MGDKIADKADKGKQWILRYLVPLIFAAAYVCLAVTSVSGKSITHDEGYHITRGVMLLEYGDLRLNTHHPYFGNLLTAIPLYYDSDFKVPSADSAGWKEGNKDLTTDELMNLNGGELQFAQDHLMVPRTVAIISFAIFIIFFYAFIGRNWGYTAAIIASTFLTFSPTFLAHGALVTTDVFSAITIFVATVLLWRYLKLPVNESYDRRFALILFGIAAFIAIMTKYNSVAVVLLWVVVIWIEGLYKYVNDFRGYLRNSVKGKHGKYRLYIRAFVRSTAVVLLLCTSWLLLLTAAHKFEYKTLQQIVYANNPEDYDADYRILGEEPFFADALQYIFEEVPLPFPYYIKGFLENVIYHNINEHETFFIGKYHDIPPTYHATAFALKEPVVTVLLSIFTLAVAVYLLVASVINFIRRRNDSVERIKIPVSIHFIFALTPLFLFALISFSSIKLGIRHIAPILPFLFMANGVVLAYYFRRFDLAKVAVTILLILLVADVIYARPDYISYFSRGIGDSQEGYKYLHDSNLDWGQNELMVEEFLAENPELEAEYRPTEIVAGEYYVISVSELFGDPPYVPEYAKELKRIYDEGNLQTVDTISNTHWVVHTANL